jgi:hypothetical protein
MFFKIDKLKMNDSVLFKSRISFRDFPNKSHKKSSINFHYIPVDSSLCRRICSFLRNIKSKSNKYSQKKIQYSCLSQIQKICFFLSDVSFNDSLDIEDCLTKYYLFLLSRISSSLGPIHTEKNKTK